ncbi:unknown protein [Seminavis robusta]|uniref:Uncharacterized protein n=1 Tax=Seminavis robusta TaxID=568900 RepID=A0A9N8HYM9_9STRA|nr:unknown protein [Seminavis robusta]|eukprot:Sro2918_g340210.1 n/a (554) ;mRNA; r:1660-3321
MSTATKPNMVGNDLSERQNTKEYWSSEIRTLGIQLNPEEWTYANKLNHPGTLIANYHSWHTKGRAPTEEEIAEIFLPLKDKQFNKILPCKQNNWQMAPSSLKANPNKTIVEILRNPYQQELVKWKNDDAKGKMAQWDTVLLYTGQSFMFHQVYKAKHPELTKVESLRASMKLSREICKQHGDVKHHIHHVWCPEFVKTKLRPKDFAKWDTARLERLKEENNKKQTARKRKNENQEKIRRAKKPYLNNPAPLPASKPKPAPPSVTTNAQAPVLACAIKPVPPGYGYSSDTDDEVVEHFSEEEEDESFTENEGGVTVDVSLEEFNKETDDGSTGSFHYPNESDMPSDNEEDVASETEELEASTLLETELLESMTAPMVDGDSKLVPPCDLWATMKNVQYNEIQSFVNHFASMHGLQFESFSNPNSGWIKACLEAWGMYDENSMGNDWKAAVKTWLHTIHQQSFPAYLSAFYELLTAQVLKDKKGQEVMREKLDRFFSHFILEPRFDLDPVVWSKVGVAIQGELSPLFVPQDNNEHKKMKEKKGVLRRKRKGSSII